MWVSDGSARVRFARSIAQGDASLRLYAILDAESCERLGAELLEVARAWQDAGVRLVQYRDKLSSLELIEKRARALRKLFPLSSSTFLILNDHVELAAACGLDGVHVGQTDASVADARAALGPDCIIGVSTHSPDQAMQAAMTDCDYVAIGPVFKTTTKLDAQPAVGLCGVQAVRAVVRKPVVAIGGIGIDSARSVKDAGADSVAVISGLLNCDGTAVPKGSQSASGLVFTRRAQDFLLRLK